MVSLHGKEMQLLLEEEEKNIESEGERRRREKEGTELDGGGVGGEWQGIW